MKRILDTLVNRNWVKVAGFVLYAEAAATLPAQTFTTLLSFDGANGANPKWPLVQGLDGNLYGTTAAGGGTTNPGTVFKITLSGALTTLHTFCSASTAAAFTVVSGSLITTTVPAGATSGTVVVTTRGALSSNVPFRVP
jgi:uncharacterized repeat protein (TIGR03803 family)